MPTKSIRLMFSPVAAHEQPGNRLLQRFGPLSQQTCGGVAETIDYIGPCTLCDKEPDNLSHSRNLPFINPYGRIFQQDVDEWRATMGVFGINICAPLDHGMEHAQGLPAQPQKFDQWRGSAVRPVLATCVYIRAMIQQQEYRPFGILIIPFHDLG